MRTAGRARGGVILPIVLVVVSLLALTLGVFLFFVQSETAGVGAAGDQHQARLAAESGFNELLAVLRLDPHNPAAWYDAPQRYRHALVWSAAYDRESDPVRKAGSRRDLADRGGAAPIAWRYSVVAPQLDGPSGTMRYGATPETAKLNVNLASDDQIRRLVRPLLVDLGIENPDEIVNAILDWRDPDREPREGGAEDEYYNALVPAYNAKNGPLDTIEELLLVKGVTAAILYGEDVNRNGILDANEDDGDASDPIYDNGDGVLNLGIAPFLTVHGRETDAALDNKPRINLNGSAEYVEAQMASILQGDELSAATLDFLRSLKRGNFDFSRLRSPADLYVGDAASGGIGGAGHDGAAEDAGGAEDDANAKRGIGVRGGRGSAGTEAALAASPVTLEELPVLMDRFSTRPVEQAQQPIFGLIQLNAAPLRVLQVVPGMTPDAAAAIVAARRTADPATLRSVAWPLSAGVVDAETFKAFAPHVSTKAFQMHVEIVGYADHQRLARRFEWVLEMIGPLPQIKYVRELTSLGPGWPLDDDNAVATAGRR